MNILTKNRILQKGDEYRHNGEWKPVPKNDFGLQVQFTDYKEVRRPSEKPILRETPETAKDARTEVPERVVSPTPHPSIKNPERFAPHQIEQMNRDIESRGAESVNAKTRTPEAESDKAPVPSHLGTGDAPLKDIPAQIDEAARLAHAVSHLPTIVSKKAHSQKRDREIIDKIPFHLPLTDEEKAALEREVQREKKATAKAKLTSHLKLTFPNPKDSDCIWTGRNGTFTGYGLQAITTRNNVMLSPIGKRGVGNCTIQFPTSVIPQLVEWLNKQI